MKPPAPLIAASIGLFANRCDATMGMPQLSTLELILLLILWFLVVLAMGAIPAALIFWRTRKKAVFLLSPVFGYLIVLLFFN